MRSGKVTPWTTQPADQNRHRVDQRASDNGEEPISWQFGTSHPTATSIQHQRLQPPGSSVIGREWTLQGGPGMGWQPSPTEPVQNLAGQRKALSPVAWDTRADGQRWRLQPSQLVARATVPLLAPINGPADNRGWRVGHDDMQAAGLEQPNDGHDLDDEPGQPAVFHLPLRSGASHSQPLALPKGCGGASPLAPAPAGKSSSTFWLHAVAAVPPASAGLQSPSMQLQLAHMTGELQLRQSCGGPILLSPPPAMLKAKQLLASFVPPLMPGMQRQQQQHQLVCLGASQRDDPADTSGLPVQLPFETASYVCQALDKCRQPKLREYFFSTPFWMDILLALAALLQAVLTLYMAVLQEVNGARNTILEAALTIFSMAYPLITMYLLIIRANEISSRKELFWILLRYKIVLDWQNWAWIPEQMSWAWIIKGTQDGFLCIPRRSHFFRYWILTLGILSYWAFFRSTWNCIIVVVMQTAGIWRFYQSTLMVERSLLSFNGMLENKSGVMRLEMAQEYLNSGIHVVTETVLRQFAGYRSLQMPSPRTLFWRNPNFEQELAAWQKQVEGDMARLPTAKQEDFPLTWFQKLRAMHFFGSRMMSIMRWHPDFAAVNVAAGWYMKGRRWPLLLGMFVLSCLELFIIFYQLPTILSLAYGDLLIE